MAEDKKTSIDLKTLTPSDLVGLLKSAFGNGNKAGMFIALAFITSFALIYLIFGKLDNQTLYGIQLAKSPNWASHNTNVSGSDIE